MNDRSKYIWGKLSQWYGTLFTERHGATPPSDWVQVLNAPDKETIQNAITSLKTSHPKFPPTLLEVIDAIKKVSKPEESYDVRKILSEYVLREYHAGRLPITLRQLCQSWRWLADTQSGLDSQGVMRGNQVCSYAGVYIPPDPRDEKSQGFKLMFAELSEHEKMLLIAKSRSRYTGEAA